MKLDWLNMLAGVAAATAAVPACAQDNVQNQALVPPNKLIKSPGGVDMVSGKYGESETDLSIGGAATAGIELQRSLSVGAPGHVDQFGDATSNFDIMITELKYDATLPDPLAGGPDYRLGVRFGGLSGTFNSTRNNGGYPISASKETADTLLISGDKASDTAIYTYTAQNGTKAVFRPIGSGDCSSTERCAFVNYVIYPDGTRMDFNYQAAAAGTTNKTLLRSVVSSRGYAILFDYTALGGKNLVTRACAINLAVQTLASVTSCAGVARQSSYSYTLVDGAYRIAQAVGQDGAPYTFTYGHDASGNLTKAYIKPGATQPWMTNTIVPHRNADGIYEDVVNYQAFADGQTLTYLHWEAVTVGASSPPLVGGSYTDAAGAQTLITYSFPANPNPPPSGSTGQPGFGDCSNTPCVINYMQMTPGPAHVRDPLGRITQYDYCDRAAYPSDPSKCLVTALQRVIQPSGMITEVYYAGKGIISELHDIDPAGVLPTRIKHYDYGCAGDLCRDKPTLIRDAKGNETLYTYSADHGGVLTELDPADANGVHPAKVYTYVQRYAWIANGAGGYVHGSAPIWLISSESTCRTSATTLSTGACAAGAADQVLTTYDYGPDTGTVGNTLLQKGVKITAADASGAIVSRLTCYGYDSAGNRISETKPRAGLTVCP